MPMRAIDPQASTRRVLRVGRVMVIALSVAFAVLLGRVIQLQTRPDPRLAKLVDAQRSGSTIQPRRGALLDRHGRLLAATRLAHRLFIDPDIIQDPNTFSERVGYELDYDPVDIELAMAERPDSRYVVIDPRLSDQRLAKVRKMNLRGLSTDAYTVRDYPYATAAGQLLGFVGRDGDGLEGLERDMNACVVGRPGKLAYTRDARGRALWIESAAYQPPRDGDTMRLSLDVVIQSLAEQYLAEAVEQYNAKSGQMIVMDPRTGEILAMANYPRFDPNDFAATDPQLARNRAVTDVFEPGSIFKPFVWAAATELGKAQPDEVIDTTDSGVWRSSRGRRLRDARGHGRITWDRVLVESSNIGMAIVGQRMGAGPMHRALTDFGFGSTTGSGLPGEVPGVVHPLDKWTHYSVTSIPMGQEIAATPLQITTALCALANGGVLLSPTIDAVDPADAPPHGRRVLPAPIAAHTLDVLGRVVSEGTGRKAQSDRYDLFGKTGTAQLPDFKRGGYHEDRYVASFIGGGPIESPRLVVGCFIHEPDKSIGHYGGTVAAPAASAVLEQALLYLGVPPDHLDAKLARATAPLDD